MQTETKNTLGELNEMIVCEIEGTKYTRGELDRVFNAVCNQGHWKGSWSASVHHSLVPVVMAAVEFFHATRAAVDGIESITGRVLMSGIGYNPDCG